MILAPIKSSGSEILLELHEVVQRPSADVRTASYLLIYGDQFAVVCSLKFTKYRCDDPMTVGRMNLSVLLNLVSNLFPIHISSQIT